MNLQRCGRTPAFYPVSARNLWKTFFDEFDSLKPNMAPRVPTTRFKEDDENYLVQIELPGLSPEDIALSIESGDLVVALEKTSDGEFKERQFFEKRIGLGQVFNPEKVRANLKNGLLEVAIEKPAALRSHRIPISSE